MHVRAGILSSLLSLVKLTDSRQEDREGNEERNELKTGQAHKLKYFIVLSQTKLVTCLFPKCSEKWASTRERFGILGLHVLHPKA